ncbi:MAG: hypothetical protein CXB60_10270 [Spiroplasma poulsonii]|nr:hypothetical protein [Spiroplasma poulsonii]
MHQKVFFKNFKLIGSKSMAWRVFEVLPKNFSEINNFWQNSGKRSTIEIKVVEKTEDREKITIMLLNL